MAKILSDFAFFIIILLIEFLQSAYIDVIILKILKNLFQKD